MDEKKKVTNKGIKNDGRNGKKENKKEEKPDKKAKKKRADKYEEKLAISGSLENVLKVAVKDADKIVSSKDFEINDFVKWSGDPDGVYYIAGHSQKVGYDFIIIHVDTPNSFTGPPRVVKQSELTKMK